MRYEREVNLQTYNTAGNIETDPNFIVKYVYTIKIIDYRSQEI